MNEQNLQYLRDNLKYLGFGENLNEVLANKLKEGPPEFSITHRTEMNRKPFEAALHFRKSDNADMYFLNSYSASLQRSSGEKMEQLFYLHNGKGVTAKEAYNLLEGRPVFKELHNKEGQAYKAWLQLDFQNKDKRNNHEVKQYHENYGYDLRTAVMKYAVAELNDPEKEKTLMHSLQKGNLQSITIEKDGAVHKMFMEANPQYKTVNLYDAQMKRVQKENIGMYQAAAPPSEAVKKEEQQVKPESNEKEKNKLSQKEDTLLPKKRQGAKKGLGIS